MGREYITGGRGIIAPCYAMGVPVECSDLSQLEGLCLQCLGCWLGGAWYLLTWVAVAGLWECEKVFRVPT
jgi:hypothetical protein